MKSQGKKLDSKSPDAHHKFEQVRECPFAALLGRFDPVFVTKPLAQTLEYNLLRAECSNVKKEGVEIMKPYKQMVGLFLAIFAVSTLAGCSKTKNSGATAKTSTSCTVRSDGTIRNGSGTLCTTGTATCPSRGFYLDSQNREVSCEPGERIYLNEDYPYGNGSSGNYNGCRKWTQQYNVLYIPMLLDDELVCVNYEWLNSYSMGTSYYNDYEYYYQFPPYSGGSHGSKCKRSREAEYEREFIKICF